MKLGIRNAKETPLLIRPARMRDVAKLAGVGTMTVSRVLNNTARVSDDTRLRVMDAISALRYSPNEIARSLREQRSRQVGIIVPNLYDPFFASCAHAISLVAKQHSYSVLVTTSDENPEVEFVEATRMLRRHIEGLIVIPANGASRLLESEFQQTPVVTLDRPVAGSRFDCVLVQNKVGSQLGVQHLIDHGYSRIAYLGLSRKLFTIKARLDGYRAALRRAGLKPDVHAVGDSKEEMHAVIEAMLRRKHPPQALFCSNNLITRNALHALSTLNIKLPEDIALVSFDDFEMADIIRPSVTVVRQPPEVMGHMAAELLFFRLAAEATSGPGRRIVMPVELVVRDSCGPHPLSVKTKIR